MALELTIATINVAIDEAYIISIARELKDYCAFKEPTYSFIALLPTAIAKGSVARTSTESFTSEKTFAATTDYLASLPVVACCSIAHYFVETCSDSRGRSRCRSFSVDRLAASPHSCSGFFSSQHFPQFFASASSKLTALYCGA